ncbi:hypothetical protein [Candidatus Nanogingivalis gingivitcus]|uniref:Uncharacterized protein n=1 Tax=Candidatus Nanogingivalis gingivitcus TaxID=2171992 RepID=A0ABY0FK88_9BACT|nr:hypothetical protein [Candidatus Nanogingivalis gingivitcus]RYC72855.1 hypothetical protein G6CMJM_00191 [Candidatus Nanogingivalis gingivitcus]
MINMWSAVIVGLFVFLPLFLNKGNKKMALYFMTTLLFGMILVFYQLTTGNKLVIISALHFEQVSNGSWEFYWNGVIDSVMMIIFNILSFIGLKSMVRVTSVKNAVFVVLSGLVAVQTIFVVLPTLLPSDELLYYLIQPSIVLFYCIVFHFGAGESYQERNKRLEKEEQEEYYSFREVEDKEEEEEEEKEEEEEE